MGVTKMSWKKLLLAIGAKLLMLFFVMRSEACSRQRIQTATGAILRYERDAKRTYYSIFGKLPLYRPYFDQKGIGGETAEFDSDYFRWFSERCSNFIYIERVIRPRRGDSAWLPNCTGGWSK
jgi:hypothetical protein